MGNSNLVNETKRVVGALTLRHQTKIEQKFGFKEICLERRKSEKERGSCQKETFDM